MKSKIPLTPARLALGLLLLGLLWRTVRYLLNFPIWGDEALLAVNFVTYGYGDLVRHLENCQVAPILFLWGERAAYCWLGAGMLSMRLLPFLAGAGSLLLYWRLARLMLAPRSRLFAVCFLSVAIWPVSMSALLKPYSCDLFASLVLLLLAVHWLKNPARTAWLISLAFLTPVMLLVSYPSVFVAAGVSAALLVTAWKLGWKTRVWFAIFNLTLLAGFLLASRIGAAQLSALTGNGYTTRDLMDYYWKEGFPPRSLPGFIWWLFLTLTGQISAYPVGASYGGSIVTVAFCVVGIGRWVRGKRWEWLTLLLAPMVFGIAAAVMHRYPFGASCRISQSFAPSICILAGLGLAAVIAKASSRHAQARKWTTIAAAVFAVIGLGGIVRDIVHPYRDIGCKWMQTTMGEIQGQVPAGVPVVMCDPPRTQGIVSIWYWMTGPAPLTWDSRLPATIATDRRLCGFFEGPSASADTARAGLTAGLQSGDPSWHFVKRSVYQDKPPNPQTPPEHLELFFFER